MDDLQLYRGDDGVIGNLQFHSPSLAEICDYGETKFFTMAYHICSIPTDYMAELDERGIRYEEVDEFDFFLMSLFPTLTYKEVGLLFPNWIPEKMQLAENESTHEVFRIDPESGVRIDKCTYREMTKLLRRMCGFKHEPRFAGNDFTRQKMIEIAKIRKKRAAKKQDKSTLLPLISAMVNCADFKYNHQEVWQMPFFAFMDSIKRVQAVRTAHEMSTGGYFGIKLADVKQYTNWMRSL